MQNGLAPRPLSPCDIFQNEVCIGEICAQLDLRLVHEAFGDRNLDGYLALYNVIDIETELVAIGIVERRPNPERGLLVERGIKNALPANLGQHAVDKHLAVDIDRPLREVDVEACVENFIRPDKPISTAVADARFAYDFDIAHLQIGHQRQGNLVGAFNLAD